MSLKCGFGFHKWSKWERFERAWTVVPRVTPFGPLAFDQKHAEIELWQLRTCERCGKMQREALP